MSHQRSADALVVYADYVCPFCYLGKAGLEQYLDDAVDPPSVEWRFYDLRGYKRGPDGIIDPDADDWKDDAYFERAHENVRRLAEQYDLEMTPDASMDVDSWNAQQVALYVREEHGEEAFRAFHDRVFDALWRDERDVGDPEVLRDIVRDVSLDPDAVDEALTDVWEGRLRERFDAARHAGVTGIPTFVYGEYVARGAIPPAQIKRLVEG